MFLAALLIILIASPALASVGCVCYRAPRVVEKLNLVASICCFVVAIILAVLSVHGPYYFMAHLILLDSLGAWVFLCTSIVYLLTSIYSIGYMREYKDDQRLWIYYSIFSAFALAMFLAAIMNNIAVYWVCIDLTTIVSTFLVCFKRSKESVEASWKYLVIVIAGLCLALLGIIFFEWGGSLAAGSHFEMTWQGLVNAVPHMSIHLAILAYILVLVGFGTKVGLTPMHTWLPDAHSEGPAPASAMLSGALLNTAMLSLARFVAIMQHAGLGLVAHTLYVVMGALSLIIAAFFIPRQTGAKRLMAYSSLEHMGVVALGFGFGGVLGIAGAMYHMLAHSLNKALMFIGCGNMMQAFHTKLMSKMRGVLTVFPRTGLIWLLGAVAITGAPPGALFLSELTIMRGGIASNNMWAVFLMIVLLIVIFCGFMMHFFRMYCSSPPEKIEAPVKISRWKVAPMVMAVVPLFLFGFWWPEGFWHYFVITAHQLIGSGF
jgi:hydrogenase-4 component F